MAPRTIKGLKAPKVNAPSFPLERIQQKVLFIRGQRVMIDADLGALYGVATRALNQAVRRNARRFPVDFVFQLTHTEKAEVITLCDHLQNLKYSPSRPLVFTEHGAIMAASMLNTPRAIEVSVHVVRAFVKLREILASNRELSHRLSAREEVRRAIPCRVRRHSRANGASVKAEEVYRVPIRRVDPLRRKRLQTR
jgi:hypothetical protein